MFLVSIVWHFVRRLFKMIGYGEIWGEMIAFGQVHAGRDGIQHTALDEMQRYGARDE